MKFLNYSLLVALCLGSTTFANSYHHHKGGGCEKECKSNCSKTSTDCKKDCKDTYDDMIKECKDKYKDELKDCKQSCCDEKKSCKEMCEYKPEMNSDEPETEMYKSEPTIKS